MEKKKKNTRVFDLGEFFKQSDRRFECLVGIDLCHQFGRNIQFWVI